MIKCTLTVWFTGFSSGLQTFHEVYHFSLLWPQRRHLNLFHLTFAYRLLFAKKGLTLALPLFLQLKYS